MIRAVFFSFVNPYCLKGAEYMIYTVDVLKTDGIQSVKVDASNRKEARIKVKKKIGDDRILGVKNDRD